MFLIKKKKIINKVLEKHLDKKIDLETILPEIINEVYPNYSKLESYEKSEQNIKKIRNLLLKKLECFDNEGLTPPYKQCKHSKNCFNGRSFILNNDSDKIKEVKKKFLQFKNIEKSLKNKKMRGQPFNNLCKHLMKLTGVKKTGITSKSWDGSIDNYGMIDIKDEIEYNPIWKNAKIIVLGQCKHKINNKVSKDELKIFKDTLNDFNIGKGRFSEICPEWMNSSSNIPKYPVVGIYYCISDYQSGAKDIAKKNGIILRNKLHIIEAIIRLGEEFFYNDEGHIKFDNTKFFEKFT